MREIVWEEGLFFTENLRTCGEFYFWGIVTGGFYKELREQVLEWDRE